VSAAGPAGPAPAPSRARSPRARAGTSHGRRCRQCRRRPEPSLPRARRARASPTRAARNPRAPPAQAAACATDKIVCVERALKPGSKYLARVRGATNLNGARADGVACSRGRCQACREDTTTTPRDTTRVAKTRPRERPRRRCRRGRSARLRRDALLAGRTRAAWWCAPRVRRSTPRARNGGRGCGAKLGSSHRRARARAWPSRGLAPVINLTGGYCIPIRPRAARRRRRACDDRRRRATPNLEYDLGKGARGSRPAPVPQPC